jgi:hypothetical protein
MLRDPILSHIKQTSSPVDGSCTDNAATRATAMTVEERAAPQISWRPTSRPSLTERSCGRSRAATPTVGCRHSASCHRHSGGSWCCTFAPWPSTDAERAGFRSNSSTPLSHVRLFPYRERRGPTRNCGEQARGRRNQHEGGGCRPSGLPHMSSTPPRRWHQQPRRRARRPGACRAQVLAVRRASTRMIQLRRRDESARS